MKTLLTATVLGGLLLAALYAGYTVWTSLEDVEISLYGYLAMGGGALFTIALGVGLMALVFYSNRSGHDDDVM